MDKLKVGDGPFGTNTKTILKLFGETEAQDIHGSYEIKKNKWVCFIYLAIKGPNGEWTRPPEAPKNCWLNIPNEDNSEFVRRCNNEKYKKLFTDPSAEYAIFRKTGRNECYFYGIFKFKGFRNEKKDECVFERVSTELNCEEWK